MSKKELIKKQKQKKYDSKTLERPAGERWVTMTNALTRSGHGLSLTEKRLVMLGVSKLDSAKHRKYDYQKGVIDYTDGDTKITAKEYAECFDLDINTAYDQLQSGAKNLYNRSISFYLEAFNRKGKPIAPTVVKMRWVGAIKYQNDEGWVELSWNPKLFIHLLNIRKQFTSYQLKQASALRSQYSWKLLELLIRFESTGFAKYSIEDFSQAMDATEKQRANFAFIRRRIIEPAVKELTEKDNWIIDWKPIKAGRKVKEVQFNFAKNPQTRLF